MALGVGVRASRRIGVVAVAAVACAALIAPTAPAHADPVPAELGAGFREPESGRTRLVLNGWGFIRFGLYDVTISGTPRRAVSISVAANTGSRNLRPAATYTAADLQATNAVSSGLLDYLLWKYESTDDAVTAAALHILAWHLAGQPAGGPAIGTSGPTTPGWGPPGNNGPGFLFYSANGLFNPLDAHTGAGYFGLTPNAAQLATLSDDVEQRARDLVSEAQSYAGPWKVDLVLDWGSFIGKVTVRTQNDAPAAGVPVTLSSPDATVPPDLVTDASGTALFVFTPFGAEAHVTASTVAPGVHQEYDVDGAGGFQRIAVGREAVIQASFSARQATIATFAKDAVDGDKVVGAGGLIVDTVQYQDLVPNEVYTAQVTWYYKDTAIATPLTTTTTFTASATGSGQVDVGPLTTTGTESGRTLVAFQALYKGPTATGYPVAVHQDLDSAAQTLTVQMAQVAAQAHDHYDNDETVFAGGSIRDTVSYLGLAPGRQYTVRVRWYETDGTSLGADTGLVSTASFFAPASGTGTIEVGPVQLTANESGKTLVAMVTLHPGPDTSTVPVGSLLDPSNTLQQLQVRTPTLISLARDDADGDKTVAALGKAVDRLAYSNLQPGVPFTARLEWHYTNGAISLGSTGLVTTKTFVPAAPTGTVDVGPTSLTSAQSGRKLVAYQLLFIGSSTTGVPLIVHELPAQISQQIDVAAPTIAAEATEGTPGGTALPGDKDIVLGSGATIVDTITLVAVAVGTPVVVESALVRRDGDHCSEPVSTTTTSTVVGPGGKLTVTLPLPEAPGDYVVYVVVKSTGGAELAQFRGCTEEAQQVTVTLGDSTPLPETR